MADGVWYPDVSAVLSAYATALRCTPAQAAAHLRDRGALEAALARPEHHATYAGADLATQAAVLAHGIAESQVFIDGNKRTAFLTMVAFIEGNGHRITAPDPEMAQWILALSQGLTVEHLAANLRAVLR